MTEKQQACVWCNEMGKNSKIEWCDFELMKWDSDELIHLFCHNDDLDVDIVFWNGSAWLSRYVYGVECHELQEYWVEIDLIEFLQELVGDEDTTTC